MKTLYFAQCLHHEENDGKNSELFYLILRNRASQKVGQKKPEFVSKIKFPYFIIKIHQTDWFQLIKCISITLIAMSLKIIPGTGRKETKGIPVPNYIALSLVQYQDNFSVLIVTFFNLGLDIQITAIPNCRLQSFFFSFFCHAKTSCVSNLRIFFFFFSFSIYDVSPLSLPVYRNIN